MPLRGLGCVPGSADVMRNKAVVASVVAIAFGGLSACAVYKPVTYFAPRPSAETKVSYTFRGLDEVASVSLGAEAKMRFVLFDEAGSPHLRLFVDIPEGERLQFMNTEILARPRQEGATVVARISTIQGSIITDGVGRRTYFSATAVLPGSTYRYKKFFGDDAIVHRSFEINVKFDAPLPEQFQIEIPTLRMTRGDVAVPPISYSRKTGSAYQGSPP